MLEARRDKAQSTLEYVVVLVAIVGVILVAASSVLQPGVQKSMNHAQDILGDAAGRLDTNIPGAASGGGTTPGGGGSPGTGTSQVIEPSTTGSNPISANDLIKTLDGKTWAWHDVQGNTAVNIVQVDSSSSATGLTYEFKNGQYHFVDKYGNGYTYNPTYGWLGA